MTTSTFSIIFLLCFLVTHCNAFLSPTSLTSTSTTTRLSRRSSNLFLSSRQVEDPFETYEINNPSQLLVYKDMKIGNGEMIEKDDIIQCEFIGEIMSTGKQFSEGNIRIQYGQLGVVIQGWTMGLQGMKIGGTRVVKIPSRYAFGPKAFEDKGIPANADLQYTITVTEKIENPVDIFLYKTGLGFNVKTAGILFFLGVLAILPMLEQ